MHNANLKKFLFFSAAGFAAICNVLIAQTPRPPTPLFSLMQLRLTPTAPAARPASLGGAFIGVADDATAAAINPAGLSFLSRPEVSLGHILGQRARDYPIAGTRGELSTHRDRNPLFAQTLVNIVYPRWGFTFALYQQHAFHHDFDFTRQQFLTIAPARPLNLHEQLGASGNFSGLNSNFSAQVIHNAIAVSKAVQRRWRIGFSTAATQFRLQLHERHYFDPQLWLQKTFAANTAALVSNNAESLYRLYALELDQFKMSWNLGLLIALAQNFNLGIVYQHLPSFKVNSHIFLPAYKLPARELDAEISFSPQELAIPFQLNLPDHFGVGLAWKPASKILAACDIVLYRQQALVDGLNLNLPQDDQLQNDGNYLDLDGKADLEAKDVLSFHGGIEYSLIRKKTILPIRFGLYTAPQLGLQAATTDVNLQREYPRESWRFHLTAGAGIVLKNVRFETSLDMSSTSIETIGSAVVRF